MEKKYWRSPEELTNQAIISNEEDLIPEGKNLLDIIDEFQNETYKKIMREYQDLLEQGKPPGPEYFTHHANKEIQNLAIELLTSPNEYARWEEHDMPLQIQLHPDINYKKDAFDASLRLKLKILMGHIENNIAVINQLQADGKEDEMIIHMRMHADLLQLREQITSQFKNVVLRV